MQQRSIYTPSISPKTVEELKNAGLAEDDYFSILEAADFKDGAIGTIKRIGNVVHVIVHSPNFIHSPRMSASRQVQVVLDIEGNMADFMAGPVTLDTISLPAEKDTKRMPTIAL